MALAEVMVVVVVVMVLLLVLIVVVLFGGNLLSHRCERENIRQKSGVDVVHGVVPRKCSISKSKSEYIYLQQKLPCDTNFRHNI